MPPLLESSLPLPLIGRGKVRDVYDAGEGRLLMIATDRISAFDCILGSPIPAKGEILNRISLFWFDFLSSIVPNHLISSRLQDYPPGLAGENAQLAGRSMLVRRAQMVEIECVARGYLSGSGWREYSAHGTVCGIPLPAGLSESARLPEPIFTPAIKAHTGHDENVSFEVVAMSIGIDLAHRLRNLTLQIYSRAAEYALSRGIILADTKFEFGFIDGELSLCDEALTPDSSRFWPADLYQPGGPQPSFDKQYVRDYLETLDWNKQPPAPVLPDDVVANTAARYREAYERLTGGTL